MRVAQRSRCPADTCSAPTQEPNTSSSVPPTSCGPRLRDDRQEHARAPGGLRPTGSGLAITHFVALQDLTLAQGCASQLLL